MNIVIRNRQLMHEMLILHYHLQTGYMYKTSNSTWVGLTAKHKRIAAIMTESC